MRDHRNDPTPEEVDSGERNRIPIDLSRHTRHPGSVRRSSKTDNRARAKRARLSRKKNR